MKKAHVLFKRYKTTVLLFALSVATSSAYAQVVEDGLVSGFAINNPLGKKTQTIPDLLVLIIEKFVLPIGGVIVTFMFIYTGFLFVMAQGNSSKIDDAKNSLKNTVIGAAIVLGALSISVIIQATVDQITKAL